MIFHIASLTLSLFLQSATVSAQTLEDFQKKYHIDAADLKKMKQLMAKTAVQRKATVISPPKLNTASLSSAIAVTHRTSTPDAASPQPNPVATTLQFLLRQDWQDIGILAGPTPTDKATGASISYNNDHIANNSTWGTHGTAAVVYTIINDQGPKPQITPFYQSIAGYVTVNKLYNSDTKQLSKNVDSISGGGALEFGWDNAAARAQNYFQLMAGAVTDNIKDTTAANLTAIWIPVNNNLHIHHPEALIGNIGYSFDPEVLVQFADTTDKKPLLFSNHAQSLRTGPQVTLLLFPYVSDGSFWSHVSSNITYHWWYEALYGGQKHWLKASVTYNFDQAGNFGLTGSYQQGHTEDTGTITNLYLVSLTGKM